MVVHLVPMVVIIKIKERNVFCEEYDSIKDTWSDNFPEQSEYWNEDENYSVYDVSNLYGHGKCPFCRSKP